MKNKRINDMKNKRLNKVSLVAKIMAFALVFCTAFSASAVTYYLSPSGNDDNNGQSESAAFKTVNKAFSAVHSHSTKDELIILPGEYAATSLLSMAGESTSNLADADVVRSSTRNPADVVIYGDRTFNLLNMASCVIVDGITFSNGVATAQGSGGGVRVGSSTTTYPTILTNCVITCCGATVAGKTAGGAYIYGGGKVLDCVIENCSATTDGGAAGVFLNNSSKAPTIEHTIIRNCSGANYSGDKTCAGGIASGGSKGGSERIADCMVSNCTTTAKGGGAYFEFGPSALVSGTTFALCHALRGGGVLVADGTNVFENCSFNENSTEPGDNGGGVLVASSTAYPSVSFRDCSFTKNEAGKGGALYAGGVSTVSASGCDFSSNISDDGGAFYVMSTPSVSMSNCTFSSNQGGFGGAATFEQDGGYFAFTNCVFASNTATNYGGAVSCGRSNFPNGSDGSYKRGLYGEFYGCTFTNNVAREGGGALFHRDNTSTRNSGTPLVLRNSLFAYNSVSTPGHYHCGGGVYLLSYDTPVVDACTIAYNNVATNGTSTQFGGGFYTRWKSSIVNTIIAHNTMNGESEGRNDWIRNTATVSYSCAHPAPKQGTDTNPFTEANQCVSADPRFKDAANGDFTLKASSPCRDKAIVESWMANVFDLAGNARVSGAAPDMGCYEYIPISGLMIFVR